MYLASICKAKRSCIGSICNVKRHEKAHYRTCWRRKQTH